MPHLGGVVHIPVLMPHRCNIFSGFLSIYYLKYELYVASLIPDPSFPALCQP